jgi:hypothetical protein
MRLDQLTRGPSLAIAAVVLASLGLSGCGGGESLGFGKVTPDEFRVVSKAPLTLPPDYSLRPPNPGEPRPQELQADSAARQAILGQQAAVQRSDGEKLLAARAGSAKADPLIRYVVDDEFGEVAHKDRSWADKVMFWRKAPVDPGEVKLAQESKISASAPVDAAGEDARIKAAIGDKPVVIKRASEGKGIKLPGL